MKIRELQLLIFFFLACTLIVVFGSRPTRTSRSQPSRLDVREVPLKWTRWEAAPDSGHSEEDEKLLSLMRPTRKVEGASAGLHYLYFWGPAYTVDVNQQTMLMSEAVQLGRLDKSDRPVFFRSSEGVVRANSEPFNGEAHLGQILSYFGDMGTPKSTKLAICDGAIDIEEAVTSTAATFCLVGEFEWQLSTLLHYIPPTRNWVNRWGEEFTFDKCTDTIVERPHGTGPCSGTHALAVASAMLNVNRQFAILSRDSKLKLEDYLKVASAKLKQNQCAGGGWNSDWYANEPPHSSWECTAQATGHHLEWILDAADEVRPNHDVIALAVQACRTRMQNATPKDCQDNICAFTHALKSVFYYEQLFNVN